MRPCHFPAGVISWMSVIPLDVVKSRIQADDPSNRKYKGMWDASRHIYREGGLKMFTRGSLAVILRAFPVNGATFVGWETSDFYLYVRQFREKVAHFLFCVFRYEYSLKLCKSYHDEGN